MKVASITLPVGFFCYSFCRSLTGFYLCAVVVGISVSFLTFLPFTLIISNWFEEKRGTALGICFMGRGLGGMLMNTLTAVLLDRYGWRASYRVIGVMMLVILIVMIWFVIRATPEQMGLQPLRKKESGTPAAEISGTRIARIVPAARKRFGMRLRRKRSSAEISLPISTTGCGSR